MCQQVSVQVSLAGVALGTVDAGVGTNVAVGQHVFLQVKLPPQTFTTFRARERFLPWTTETQQTAVNPRPVDSVIALVIVSSGIITNNSHNCPIWVQRML